MDAFSYLGYKMDDFIPVLKENGIQYVIIETDNPKLLRVGNEMRIVNIKDKGIDGLIIYVSYF